MTTDKLKDLLEMEKRATEGPWHFFQIKGSQAHTVTSDLKNARGDICNVLNWPDNGAKANSALISEARNSLKPLIELLIKAEEALKKSVNDYGKPGGPWNVPSEPGTWISMAREALAAIEAFRRGE